MADTFQGVSAIANIDADLLRSRLRQTMVLGMPPSDAEKPTFYFEREVDFAQHDNEGNPWDWEAAPVLTSVKPATQIICAYEFFEPLGRQAAHQTEVGEFNPTTLRVTLFEDEFVAVRGFSYVKVGVSEARWYFRHWTPVYGLGRLAVIQVTCSAVGVS